MKKEKLNNETDYEEMESEGEENESLKLTDQLPEIRCVGTRLKCVLFRVCIKFF